MEKDINIIKKQIKDLQAKRMEKLTLLEAVKELEDSLVIAKKTKAEGRIKHLEDLLYRLRREF